MRDHEIRFCACDWCRLQRGGADPEIVEFVALPGVDTEASQAYAEAYREQISRVFGVHQDLISGLSRSLGSLPEALTALEVAARQAGITIDHLRSSVYSVGASLSERQRDNTLGSDDTKKVIDLDQARVGILADVGKIIPRHVITAALRSDHPWGGSQGPEER